MWQIDVHLFSRIFLVDNSGSILIATLMSGRSLHVRSDGWSLYIEIIRIFFTEDSKSWVFHARLTVYLYVELGHNLFVGQAKFSIVSSSYHYVLHNSVKITRTGTHKVIIFISFLYYKVVNARKSCSGNCVDIPTSIAQNISVHFYWFQRIIARYLHVNMQYNPVLKSH